MFSRTFLTERLKQLLQSCRQAMLYSYRTRTLLFLSMLSPYAVFYSGYMYQIFTYHSYSRRTTIYKSRRRWAAVLTTADGS